MFGPPVCLISDNGPQFISHEFESFLLSSGVNHIKSPPYHPASNGLCERFVRTFKLGLIKMSTGSEMKEAIAEFLQEYRSCPHPSLDGETPAYKFLGRQIKSKIDLVNFLPKKESGENNLHQKIVEEKNDKNSKKFFNVGDCVWIREHTGHGNWSRGTIVHERGEYIYEVKMENNSIRIAHTDQLRSRKPYELRSRTHTLIEET